MMGFGFEELVVGQRLFGGTGGVDDSVDLDIGPRLVGGIDGLDESFDLDVRFALICVMLGLT